MTKRPFAHCITTGIFGSYGPILADCDEAQNELLDAAVAFTRDSGATHLHIKTLRTSDQSRFELSHPQLVRKEVWLTALLPLGCAPQQLWADLPGQMRSKVRKAEKSGLTVRFGRTEEDLKNFYDVLADNMHRKGAPIYGLPFMRSMMKHFGDQIEVCTLWKDGKCTSGALVLTHKGVIYVPFVSSRAVYFPLRPNNLMYWEIMKRGCEGGARLLDFGTSLKGATTFAFKLSWGAQEQPLYSYVFSPKGEDVRLDPGSAALQAGVKLWQTLPRPVADMLGPKLIRFMT